jgi:hypothetical protein
MCLWLLLAKSGQSTMFPICLDFEEQDPLGCSNTHDMKKCRQHLHIKYRQQKCIPLDLNFKPIFINVLAKFVTVAMWVMLNTYSRSVIHIDQSRVFQTRKMKLRETILVTTTVGGMGQFAIQVNNLSHVFMFSHFM